MRRISRGRFPAFLSLSLTWSACLAASAAQSSRGLPPLLKGVNIEQRLNAQVPLDLTFRDETGRAISIGDCLHGKPTILVLAQYRCPRLCTQVLNGLLDSLETIRSLNLGEQYNVMTVSFDPRETPDLAARKKEPYIGSYGRGDKPATGWHFLTGERVAIGRLCEAVGFHFTYDPVTDQFAHASAIMILSPLGKVSRYYYGIDYAPTDLRLGLVEASENKIGSPADQFLLFCFHYDPETGKYAIAILNIVRAGGILTMLGMGLFFVAMRRQERKRIARRADLNSEAQILKQPS